jgi:hypothetical protein
LPNRRVSVCMDGVHVLVHWHYETAQSRHPAVYKTQKCKPLVLSI